jgi:glycosyltransferase involved in cell wall biosynthesis
MRIGIDARPMDSKKMTGIDVYVTNLVNNLAEIDKANEYILYFASTRRKAEDMPGPSQANFTKKVIKLPYMGDSDLISFLWIDCFLPFQLRRDKVDIFHSTYAQTPICNGFKKISTIHDLNFMVCPELSKTRLARSSQKAYKRAILNSDNLISISKNTVKDIKNVFGINSMKVNLIYPGIDDNFRVIKDKSVLNEVRRSLNLPKRFILALGSKKRRKNIDGLIMAFSIFLNKYKLDYKLVITNMKPTDVVNFNSFDEITRANIVFLEYIPVEKLLALYNLSSLFLYPSLYEGFGFPPLEAMACGVPVLASNTSCLPEIIGDAGLLVDPYSPEAIAECIYKILADKDLRKSFIRKGFNRIKAFDWKKTAMETLDLYKKTARNIS